MSKKQQIESSITPELTPIEDRLLDCAKKGKPVLLHGQDTIGRREELFYQTYEAIGGIRRSNECFIANDAFDLRGNPVEIIEPSPSKEKMEMRWNDNTCGYIDYGYTVGNKKLKYSLNKRFAVYVQYYGGGMFVDNFYVNKDDVEDVGSINLIIGCLKRDMNIPNKPKSFKWLVVYTDDLKSLPRYFREQFKEVCLEAEKQKEIDDTTPNTPVFTFNWSVNENRIYSKGKLIATLPNIPFKLFAQLNKKTGQYVKNSTLEKCWDKKPNYDRFLTGTINKLENTLKENLKLNGTVTKHRIIEPKSNDTGKYIAYKLKP